MNNKIMRALIFILPLALFGAGLLDLFMLRFKTGAVYPVYSSLRSDPLGTKIVFRSFGRLPDVSSERNFKPLKKIKNGDDTTLFFLGARTTGDSMISKTLLDDISRIGKTGGRIAVAFYPVRDEKDAISISWKKEADEPDGEKEGESDTGSEPTKVPGESLDGQQRNSAEDKDNADKKNGDEKEDTSVTPSDSSPKPTTGASGESPDGLQRNSAEDGDKGDKKNGDDADSPPDETEDAVSMFTHLGIRYAYDTENRPRAYAALHPEFNQLDLPESVNCKTALYFDTGPGWQTLYTHYGHPVIVEKKMGKGSLVFIADTFLFSNEAMKNERHPGLLAWLAGENSRMVFDEFHLGIQQQTGVAGLAKKYRLHGLFWGLLVFAVLFIWKNSLPLVPPRDEADEIGTGGVNSERDHTDGLISLLRRNISNQEILNVCYKEWRKGLRDGPPVPEEKMKRVEAVFKNEGKRKGIKADPVKTYNEIRRILSSRSKTLSRNETSEPPPSKREAETRNED